MELLANSEELFISLNNWQLKVETETMEMCGGSQWLRNSKFHLGINLSSNCFPSLVSNLPKEEEIQSPSWEKHKTMAMPRFLLVCFFNSHLVWIWHPVPSLHGKQMGKKRNNDIFIFSGSKITVDCECSHEIKRIARKDKKAFHSDQCKETEGKK